MLRVGLLINAQIGTQFSGATVEARLAYKALSRFYSESTGNSANTIKPVRINPWDLGHLDSLDVLHCYQQSFRLPYLASDMHKVGVPIIHSPIIDSMTPKFILRMLSLPSVPVLYNNSFVSHRIGNSMCDRIHVRSLCERSIVADGYGIEKNLIHQCLLGFDLPDESAIRDVQADLPIPIRESTGEFVFHVSGFYRSNKNIIRLAKACRKINVPLVVAGYTPSASIRHDLISYISDICTIFDLGQITEEEKVIFSSKAGCFALPSHYEGVGLSALEAASLGIPICITSNGGARDYFSDYAQYVNPLSVDSIASGLHRSINRGPSPRQTEYISSNFDLRAYGKRLADSYVTAKAAFSRL